METFVVGAIVGLLMLAFLTVVNKGQEKISEIRDDTDLKETKRKIDEGSVTTDDMLAEGYRQMFTGKVGEAMKTFKKVLNISPLEAEALNALAYYHFNNGNKENALAYSQKLFDESLDILSIKNWDEFIYEYSEKKKSEGKLTLSLPQLCSNLINYHNRNKELNPEKAKQIESSIFYQNIIQLPA